MAERFLEPERDDTSGLLFLEIDPSEAVTEDVRRRIRSHVTRGQHEKRRQISKASPVPNAPRYVSPAPGTELQQADLKKRIPIRTRPPPSTAAAEKPSTHVVSSHPSLAFLSTDHPSQTHEQATRKFIRSHAAKWQHRQRHITSIAQAESDSSADERGQAWPVAFCLPSPAASDSERLISKGAAAFQNVVLKDSDNTLGLCINRLGFDLRGIMVI